MKAPPFAYVRPATVDDVLGELSDNDGAKVIAGGQSLVPVLAMRLARPTTLVDVNAVEGLDVLRRDGRTLRVGARVRQRQVEHHHEVRAVPLLAQALPWVGHRELRSRGTVVGSLAHADPAAELPAVAVCLDAVAEVVGPGGGREVSARELFTGAMTTEVAADELLAAVRFPTARTGQGFGFAELARRHGDFALAGVVARVDARSREDVSPRAEITCFGVSDTPVFRDVSSALAEALSTVGACVAEKELAARLNDSSRAIADDVVDTAGDAHGSAGYRRRVLAALTARELARAYVRARTSLQEESR